jgi:aspartyl-tRNA(Asn)/glutamyl-tRNA(Gln) amidotransferase subunit A
MTVISRPDSRDWYALPFEGSDYEQGLRCRLAPGGIRIALSPTLGLPVDIESNVYDTVTRAGEVFRELGASVQRADPPGVARSNAIHATLWPACCNQLAGSMPDGGAQLDPSLQAYAHAGNDISREALLGALVERGELGAAVNAFFEQHDILICPVYPCVAMPLDGLPAGNALFPHFTAWCNQSGLPAASVYGGMTDSGLPVGVQIVGARHADALVLWACYVFEQAFGRAPLPELARGFRAAGHGRTPS